MSAASSAGSAASTTDSTELGFDTSSSVSRILGDATCSEHGGPESPSTTTYAMSDGLALNPEETQRRRIYDSRREAPPLSAEQGRGHGVPTVLISSQAAPMKYQPLRKLTGEQVGQAIWLYQEGLSLGEVASVMNVTRQAMHDLLKRRIKLRDRIEALPRKEPTAVREKRARTRQRYRERAARITAAQMRRVKERDQVCVICGAEGTMFDHIVAVALGGPTELWNLQLLCRPCHVEKSRTDRRWIQEGVTPSEAFRRSTFSAEASRSCAKTSPSPDNAAASPANDPASSMSSHESRPCSCPSGSSLRTFLDF